jgi:DNA (cytosine-5)-methyltransferase 1
MSFRAVSLFSGAGGMDYGMRLAGFRTVFANDFDEYAVETLRNNLHKKNHKVVKPGSITKFFSELEKHRNVELLHGGPPCQGFSVAGKMDPKDPRSAMLWHFCKAVEIVRPSVFVLENVAALGRLERWTAVRARLFSELRAFGYAVSMYIAKSCDYGVPQTRERVFFIGRKGISEQQMPHLAELFAKYINPAKPIGSLLLKLGRPGTDRNTGICRAKITLAIRPVLRKSAYAGMLFNGLGRPLNPLGYAPTMHASMGGNKTPFIDEIQLYDSGKSWVEEYHRKLLTGKSITLPRIAPSCLRRITISEAAAIQTFPSWYKFSGPSSAQYRQIGNAVPCDLAKAVGQVCRDILRLQPK